MRSERTVSLRAVGDGSEVPADLRTIRDETDAATKDISDLASVLLELNPEVGAKRDAVFGAVFGHLPAVRRAVDTRQATVAGVDDFYTQLAGLIVLGMEVSARSSSDPQTVAEEIVTADLMRVTDLHARATGRAVGALASGGLLSSVDRLVYTRLVGAFHSRLEAAVPRLL